MTPRERAEEIVRHVRKHGERCASCVAFAAKEIEAAIAEERKLWRSAVASVFDEDATGFVFTEYHRLRHRAADDPTGGGDAG